MRLIKIDVIAWALYWIATNYSGVPNKEATECILI